MKEEKLIRWYLSEMKHQLGETWKQIYKLKGETKRIGNDINLLQWVLREVENIQTEAEKLTEFEEWFKHWKKHVENIKEYKE